MTQAAAPNTGTASSKGRKVGLLCLLVVIFGVLGKILFLGPLPRGAYPVLSTAGWAGKGSPNAYPHQWLPNGDLAFLITDAHGMLQVCYQKIDEKGPVGAVRYGPELPLGSWGNAFFASPDEQWIATMKFTNPSKFQTFLTSADGKTTPQSGEYFAGWLPDSRSYLAISWLQTSVTKVRHLDSPRAETIPEASAGGQPIAVSSIPSSPEFLIGSQFYYPLGNSGKPQDYPLLTLRTLSAAQPGIVQQTWQATVPTGMTFGTLAASPNNQYLLWIAGEQQSTPWSDWLGRLNVNWHRDPTYAMHYFLTDLHGNHKRAIFTNVLGGTYPLAPRWTPDSKHVSFIYKEQLYLLPVE